MLNGVSVFVRQTELVPGEKGTFMGSANSTDAWGEWAKASLSHGSPVQLILQSGSDATTSDHTSMP